jgi:hypothetical protein
MTELFAVLAALIIVAGAPPYLYDILKGKTKPQRITWFIWGVLSTIAFISQAQLHGGWSLVFVGLNALGGVLVFLLSLHYGVGGWTRLDQVALVVASVGVIISLAIKQPIVALAGVVLADAAGVVPTIRKTLHDPESETTITWLLIGTASLLGALSVGRLEFGLLLYPVYLALSDYAILVAKAMGRSAIKRQAQAVPIPS